ncbi:MAG TPA: DNA starvation/stationary phase protection protein [Hyphomicrobium sp.]|nr:DNA starvation/stationary phase protection protein [Hyphomicrobium sp.]
MDKAHETQARAPRKPSKANGDQNGVANLATPTDLDKSAVKDVAEALNGLVADTFALYLKTKNFHWHVSGPNFRDYHLLLDEQAAQIFAAIDPLAERVRKLGEKTVRSLSEVARLSTIKDNEVNYVPPNEMIDELLADNRAMAQALRKAHKLCDDADDAGTSSLLEVYIDETERRIWFLFETARTGEQTGH